VSRERTRPTREETRQRIFEAAAGVFAEHGVAGATIEQIAAAAGFTRGAFYSNFAGKDELAVAMLEDHLSRSSTHNRALLDTHGEPDAFVRALRADEGREDDPLHRNPLLQVELMLYAARTPELRPALGRRLATMRSLVGEIAASTVAAARPGLDLDPARLGLALVAIEDGLRLHRLVDPDSTPADAFVEVLDWLRVVVASGRG
jgi:AcrR family transcriptional regulator